MTLTFVILTLKQVSKSRVTWATSVPILVFLSLTVLELGPMYATDVRQKHRLMPPPIRGGGIIMQADIESQVQLCVTYFYCMFVNAVLLWSLSINDSVSVDL